MTVNLRLALGLTLSMCMVAATGGSLVTVRDAGSIKHGADRAVTLIKAEFHEQVIIIKRFDGPLNLTGYVVELPQPQTPLKPPLYSVIYTDPTNSYVLAGVGIFDKDGRNQTRLALEKYAPHTDYSAVYTAAAHGTYFKEGRSGVPFIYAFFDANCIFCNKLWLETRGLVRDGRLQIRWVPVGIIKRDSEDKAAGILAARDPVAALAVDETDFDHVHEEGGFSLAHDKIPPAAVKEVRANDKIMREAGFYGTPVLLYKTRDGVDAKLGLPSNQDLERIRLSVKSANPRDDNLARSLNR